MEVLIMAFGETLTALRKSMGLSQEQLAEELDLTRQTISKWELNQSTPDIEYIIRLSNFFEVSTDHLIKGEKTAKADEHVKNIEQSVTSDERKRTGYKLMCAFSALISAVALMGIIAFVVASSQQLWTATFNGMTVTGLIGFLVGTKTLWFFAILCVIFILDAFVFCLSVINLRKK